MFYDFSEHTTIQGLVYIFSNSISFFGKTFWLLSICFMFSIGLFWTVQMYTNWQGQQVLPCFTWLTGLTFLSCLSCHSCLSCLTWFTWLPCLIKVYPCLNFKLLDFSYWFLSFFNKILPLFSSSNRLWQLLRLQECQSIKFPFPQSHFAIMEPMISEPSLIFINSTMNFWETTMDLKLTCPPISLQLCQARWG
jgi:hypothetical protein